MTDAFDGIREMFVTVMADTANAVIAFGPNLIAALLVLLVGWAIGRLLQIALERSLSRGFDGLVERSGLGQALLRAAITAKPSAIAGRVGFWLVMILFLMGASEILGLDAVSSAITRILAYIPTVVSAALVLGAGVFLARFAGNVVTTGAAAAGISYARGLGAVTRVSIVVMVGVVTLEQLGVNTQIMTTVLTAAVAAITFGIGLAFALGATPVVRGILASHYLRQTFEEGTSLELSGAKGVIEEIGPVNTALRDGKTVWRVPNGRLVEELLKVGGRASK